MDKQISSVADLIRIIGVLSQDDELMFRGQSRDWPLLPGIGRFDCGGYANNWRAFHEDVVERFWRLATPHLVSRTVEDVEKWVIAQHHGLPTRLLDTTLNPLKAMHFSVSDPRDDPHDGVLWVFTYNGFRQDLDERYRKFWDAEITAFLPAQIHPRLTAQEGAFICYPLPANAKKLPALDKLPSSFAGSEDIQCHKFLVPAKQKRFLRFELLRLGARHSLLFPDLDGVAREVTFDLLEGVSR
jgi:hypothetical protein